MNLKVEFKKREINKNIKIPPSKSAIKKVKEVNGLRLRYTFVNHCHKDGIE